MRKINTLLLKAFFKENKMMKQKIFYSNHINELRAFYAKLRFKTFNVYTPFLNPILWRNEMQKKKNFARKKYISQLLFDDIKNFLSDKHDITRKELCNTFKLFKYNTLKAEDSLISVDI